MIGIRVDANKKIATGHVMRCLSIAHGLKKACLDCLFITVDENTEKKIASYGFKVIYVNSQWDDLEKETKQLVEIIQKFKLDKLIVDSYYVTINYLKQLMKHTKVIYIDDMNFFQYPVSMLINYNIYYEQFLYQEIYAGTKTQLLLGSEFAPLRDEFNMVEPVNREIVKKVLITTGGTDQFNVAGKLLNRIIEEDLFEGIEFHVVVGKLNDNFEYLKARSVCYSSITLHYDVKDMSKLMSGCDIAITAGGTTIYELCACGIPSISFSFADNQLYAVEAFENEKLIEYAGDIRGNEGQCISKIINYLEQYINSSEKRREMSISMKQKVDGNGVKRIVQAINELF